MLVNSRMKSASGAVHLIGNFSLTTLILVGGRANPKSATLKHSHGECGLWIPPGDLKRLELIVVIL